MAAAAAAVEVEEEAGVGEARGLLAWGEENAVIRLGKLSAGDGPRKEEPEKINNNSVFSQ